MPYKTNGLNRTEKLHDKHAFDAAFSSGRRLNIQSGLFLIKKNKLPYARAGIIIGKKKVKRAVQRNHLKRLFREWFRLHKLVLPGVDLVFVVRKEFNFSEMLLGGDKLIQYAKNSNLVNPSV